LLIRAWTEADGTPRLWARVTSRSDAASDDERLRLLTDPDEVVAEVRAWLADVEAPT